MIQPAVYSCHAPSIPSPLVRVFANVPRVHATYHHTTTAHVCDYRSAACACRVPSFQHRSHACANKQRAHAASIIPTSLTRVYQPAVCSCHAMPRASHHCRSLSDPACRVLMPRAIHPITAHACDYQRAAYSCHVRVVTDVPHTHATCHHTGAAGPCVTACRLLTPRAPYPQSPCRVLMPRASCHVHHTFTAQCMWSTMPGAHTMSFHAIAFRTCGPTCRVLKPRASYHRRSWVVRHAVCGRHAPP